MIGYFYKDLLLSKFAILTQIIFLGIISLTSILFATLPQGSSAPLGNLAPLVMLEFYAFLLTNAINQHLFQADERRTWQYFALSTPQKEQGQIGSKYVLVLLVNLVTLLWLLLLDCVFGHMAEKPGLSTSSPLLLFFSLMLVMDAIEMPFVFRFGSTYGTKCKGFLLLGIFGVVAIYLLYGDISFLRTGDPLSAFLEKLQGGTMHRFLDLLPYIAAVLYFLSYCLSLKIMKKGIEAYEE